MYNAKYKCLVFRTKAPALWDMHTLKDNSYSLPLDFELMFVNCVFGCCCHIYLKPHIQFDNLTLNLNPQYKKLEAR